MERPEEFRRIKLTLPFPPSVNTYWTTRVIKKGSRAISSVFLSDRGREYKKAVFVAAHRQNAANHNLKKSLAVMCHFYMPDNRQRDLDNYLKALLDAMADCKVYINDCQIDDLHLKRKDVAPPGRVEIWIIEIEPRGQLSLEEDLS